MSDQVKDKERKLDGSIQAKPPKENPTPQKKNARERGKSQRLKHGWRYLVCRVGIMEEERRCVLPNKHDTQ